MKKSKTKKKTLNGIPRIKYLVEELSEKERAEYFEYKRFVEFQMFLTGII